jgi:hypothetical protein
MTLKDFKFQLFILKLEFFETKYLLCNNQSCIVSFKHRISVSKASFQKLTENCSGITSKKKMFSQEVKI